MLPKGAEAYDTKHDDTFFSSLALCPCAPAHPLSCLPQVPQLEARGYNVAYREFDGPHVVRQKCALVSGGERWGMHCSRCRNISISRPPTLPFLRCASPLVGRCHPASRQRQCSGLWAARGQAEVRRVVRGSSRSTEARCCRGCTAWLARPCRRNHDRRRCCSSSTAQLTSTCVASHKLSILANCQLYRSLEMIARV